MAQNGSYSDYTSIESGVHQGSVFGPLLFLVYINDLERNIESKVTFFADDTMLFPLLRILKYLQTIWITTVTSFISVPINGNWNLTLGPTKQATEVVFSCQKSSPNHPPIMFNRSVVARMNEQKHLGLILDSSLSFKKHLNKKNHKG